MSQDTQILEESNYFETCITYALSVGWVKEQQVPILKDRYLSPIYRKYRDLLEEVEEALTKDQDPKKEEKMHWIRLRLIHILESTRRIGSTDSANIVRTIQDYVNWSCLSEEYLEYAATSLEEHIRDLVYGG